MDVWSGGGVFTHVADSSEWKTIFYFHNMDSTTIYVRIVFWDDKGTSFAFPIEGVNLPPATGVTFSMTPNSTKQLATAGQGALKQGYAEVMTCDRKCSDPGSVYVQSRLGAMAVFRQRVAGRQDSEAVVPMELPDRVAHLVFDNRQGYATGFAFVNQSDSADTVAVAIWDDTGNILKQESVTLAPWEKRVFSLADKYAETAGKHGSFDLTGRAVAALGLRFSPGGSFTSSHAMVPAP
jgi:hypothetical protein